MANEMPIDITALFTQHYGLFLKVKNVIDAKVPLPLIVSGKDPIDRVHLGSNQELARLDYRQTVQQLFYIVFKLIQIISDCLVQSFMLFKRGLFLGFALCI